MSQNQAAPPPLPQPDEALAVLQQNVLVPYYFEFLKQGGVSPENEQQASVLLDMGVNLAARDAQKQAQAHQQASSRQASLLQKAAADLGMSTAAPAIHPTMVQNIKQAAQQLAKQEALDPYLFSYLAHQRGVQAQAAGS